MLESSQVQVLTSAWPIVVAVLPRQFVPGWVEDFDASLRAVFARRERFVLITDSRPVSQIPSATQRSAIRAWLVRPDHHENQKRWNIGSSTIIDSAPIRGALQALYWLWTPPTPQHVARDLSEAWGWGIAQLAEAGLPHPDPEAGRARIEAKLSRIAQTPAARSVAGRGG